MACQRWVHQLVDVVRRDPDVSGVFAFTGATAYNPTENTARMFMQLKPHDQRSLTSNQIIQRLRPKVAAIQGVRFFMQSGQDISVGGRLSRTLYQYTLTDTDPDELNHWAPILERAMKKLPELQDVASDQQVAAPHIGIDIDRDAASRMGISPSVIDATLYDAFGQRQVATIYTTKNQYKVILEVEPQFQDDPTALSKIYVAGPDGAQIPISAFAHFTPKIESLSVNHQGQFPAVTLSFNLAPGVSLGQAVERSRRWPRNCVRRRRSTGHSRDRAGVSGIAVFDATVGRGGDPCRLYRPGHPVRKLHSPDNDPLRIALGRRRRVAGADAAAL